LTWWLIGISLIASNISTEHFVGMAGRGYELGLAIASYEWTAAVAMVLVAIFFLPKFLKTGITTIPEYLEHRYSASARGLMAAYMMFAYIFVAIAAVVYAGALNLQVVFGDSVEAALKDAGFLDRVDLPGLLGEKWLLILGGWTIGIIAGIYTVWGGLKAVVWADLFNGLGLLFGGLLVTVLGFMKLGGDLGFMHGVSSFFNSAGDKLSTVKPFNHGEMPWLAVFVGGLWLPQIFYWGLNQFITQRTLGAKSVAEGQKGVLFAASLKLIIPFIIVFPGIMAWQLAAQGDIGKIGQADAAYPHLIKEILPGGLRGLMFACLFGAVMSSLDSMLNSASTIFTIDLYKRHVNPQASNRKLITIGRLMTAVFVVVGCTWAPLVSTIGGGSVFKYIQMVWGFISPGVVAAFLFGIFSKRTPPLAAVGAMLLGIPVYAWCLWMMPEVAFLHHMAITFIVLAAYMMLLTVLMPLKNVEAASAASDGDEPRPGLFQSKLVPYVTALFGGAVFSSPILVFISVLTWRRHFPDWVHIVAAAVVLAIYVAVTVYVMRLPTSSIRRVVSRPEKPEKAARALRPVRCVACALATFAAAFVLAVHVYLLVTWITPTLERQPRIAGVIKPYVEKTYQVVIPAIVRPRETTLIAPVFEAEEVVEEPVVEDEDQGDEENEAMEDAGGVLEMAPGMPAEEKLLVEVARFGDYVIELRGVRVVFLPLAVAAVAVLLFLAGLLVIWLQPAEGETELPVTDKIDLVPSPLIKFWGIAIALATVGLYYVFF
jgi:SSS family solute:Na+ symporter